MITNFHNGKETAGLLADFNGLTGIKICIYDSDGREISYYPDRFTKFCQYVRSHPELDQKCRDCDNDAVSECRRTQKAKIYTCHAGLTECIAPIVLGGSIIGFIAMGQMREFNRELPPIQVRDKNALNEYYEKLQKTDRRKIECALHVLEACAGYEQLKSYVRQSAENFAARFQSYIDAHLCDNPDIDTLCAAFSLSRSGLYQNTQYYFHCTPACFVRLRRLHRAEHLLATTRRPVYKIAAECGIGDYNYFSKLFKKHYGCSPSQYRNGIR